MARRSLLFSPGDRPELMRKAPATGADVVCFDLEDAVAPGRKDEARAAVRGLLADPDFDPDTEVCVRLTATDPAADLDALVGASAATGDVQPGTDDAERSPRLDAVMLPKVEGADRVDRAAALCTDRGLDPAVFALVETAGGVLAAEAIADAEPTDALVFGAEDLAADLGATRTDEGTEVLYAREHAVLAAGAADVDALDTVYTDFSDTAGLREETAFARTLGYDGKLAIHPSQVEPINEAFTPDPDEVEWAARVLDACDEADRDDRGVFSVDGEMIDAPLIARAERIVERAAAAGLDPR
ncbi:CoA ester lyase [Halorubrum sp. Ib24]|uniref:HpcH/HpaI aldolase/citrate lyase family protein n=1 Tax=unclassified Halorubrum TaxID=2642239 RepID=UPI000B980235|nr:MULTISPECIES: CoA ester lyase [unclassified Halorubrum]OYR39041.1 CoA ester lyase [Halorubrum sp. Ib24]OYR40386.1 CoA ester lyase [Halorubrum sp. Hd13]OYR45786.1 CoA ester lyase [Halorubrum sp. Eb13]OYR48508.1 CoA ester lyase [Halorubrum sp. Ea8]OYR50992.1 CoA ester lyase [Halorubrum sp. Ea1]